MPELPEVETTRRGIAPHLEGREITEVIVRQTRLRVPVPGDLIDRLVGARVLEIRRRAKYLLFSLEGVEGMTLLWHLGMSGSLRIARIGELPKKHDHLDLVLDDGTILRYHDPRRFGFVDWLAGSVEQDRRLARLGPEPLSMDFDGQRLYSLSRGRRLAVKPFLMDNAVVVGVGNIYAAEALFAAGISPLRAAGRVSGERYARLAAEIKRILQHAITRGGTTLRDFISPDGAPGYFEQELSAYGRGGQPCTRCGRPLKQAWLAQRATVGLKRKESADRTECRSCIASASAASSPQVQSAGLIAHTWGVEVRLVGTGFDQGGVYRAAFRTRDGQLLPAGEFLGTGEKKITCNLQAALLRPDTEAFVVMDAAGVPVLSATLA
jgi:formamidopyrimidine-DNA glycosylase